MISTSTAINFASPSVPLVSRRVAIDCTVCLESLEASAFSERNITAACNHEPNVCLACLAKSITAQFTSKIWDHIDCPACGQRLDFMDVKAFADPVVFERQVRPFICDSDLANLFCTDTTTAQLKPT